jgi:Zn-dependent peptidase ImmA (M78 family)
MIVRLMDLPPRIKGFVTMRDGEPVIVLNARLSHEENVETYLHELKHLERNDFDCSDADVGLIESEAHTYTDKEQ